MEESQARIVVMLRLKFRDRARFTFVPVADAAKLSFQPEQIA